MPCVYLPVGDMPSWQWSNWLQGNKAAAPIRATRCEEGSPGCLGGERCLTHDLWSELGEQIRLFLAHVTLADVVAGNVVGRAAIPRADGPLLAAGPP